ncbi:MULTISPECIES: aldehyde dehydrogenase family protein [unclassified Parafrankia]|uniref:aldehyde dehydrogenase family protein n=1 Tax=unclassified Parafrankia TaxID=2994368 RepID=UPI000DA57DAC|nr:MULTISPECIES: aldehyde dehydrogenase family protein [unclassified Parafrankia]TCJ31500.1 aldehyde dehydrogenase family protein [Parafrankia sp. BMG5.11]SQD99815.1 3-succinoylsemialdehyde-pyridine dehydrogenase [Parafrankia sp. Ea1.12]
MSALTYQLYIDGAWRDSDGDGVLEVLNPATEEVIGAVPDGTVSDVDRAVAAARRAFDEGPWPTLSANERATVLLRMADVMERRVDELKELSVREAGSTRALADTLQVSVPLHHFRDMAERVLRQFPFERAMLPTVGPTLAQGVVRREPYGVAALISAYNFPLFLNILKLAPALAAGCTVVLKPAPTTPLEAFVLGEMADEAGLPPGVLNIVSGGIAAGEALTTHPGVDIVSFTGSDTVGRLVYAQAAPSLKKVVLELGGKSANIITADVDLDLVVPTIVNGMTTHAGQGCSLLTRTLVHRSRLDELVGLVKQSLDHITVGDPADPATTMGPLISAAQRAKVESLISAGRAEGAQVAYGGGRPAHLDKGFFVEPTLFVDVDNSMTVARKEFFGPVGVVIAFDDDDEAVRLANDSEFGLGGGVWAQSPVRAYEIAKRLRTGMIYINGGGAGSSPHTAFGGYKQSGLGLERGEFGLEEFLLSKSIIWSAR